ncbi:ATP-binding cassette domain-containing protein [Listeria ivanovii]|uniref:Putative ABC transporter, ATP-binding protein n=1 Tax=Listeria ivanovii (strain ATCC BAA-678 / PAM 55) TaxID=881621 RepID=G2ZD07_LISIP|nr:ABC transporter ATP-binding protein/permease [Listeria ivanovii]AHI55261.1 ABC transporter ATP-binding protein [Listeria ivanovii WSLC3009]AIS64715.1 ABC transporter ATP-binding protein [Listeria ivanovii subsp. ivanovii]MBC1758588.1 ATP-binding cassette domain-containing protein [Listeria ivanovii]MCJ1716517.1 ATP-binding cassette domain-containing protein [Listeria ivanovii]MCJ1721575.1 ATP-binding cassette domain-containing protein [Listeria ivanovii]
MLEIKALQKAYKLGKKNEVPVLKNVNVTIQDGEFAAIIGKSGSSKSTLLNIISGLDTDYSGEVLYNGENLQDIDLDKYHFNHIGFIFQSFHLVSHMSVIENVKVPLYLNAELSESERNIRALELLRQVGLEEFANQKPTQLSGGQKQRVAIARSLANNPDMIIADEPTGALDSVTSEEIIKLLKELTKQGTTVIVVTHDLNIADKTDAVLRLADGEVVSFERKKAVEQRVSQKKEKKLKLNGLAIAKISFRSFFNRKFRNLLVALGTSIGIIAILLAFGLGNGVNQSLSQIFGTTFSPNQITTYYMEDGGSKSPEPTTPLTGSEVKKIKQLYQDEGVSEVYERTTIQGIKFEYDGKDLKGASNEMQEANFKPARYEDLTVEDEYLLSGEMVKSDENGAVIPSSVARAILGKSDSAELTKKDGDKLIGKKIYLLYAGRNSDTENTIKIETVITGITNPSKEGFASGFNVSTKTMNDFIEATGIEKPILSVDAFTETTNQAEKVVEKYENDKKWANYSITNANAFVDTFSQFTDIIVYLIAFIAGLSLAVAGVMIAIVLYIGVVERTREIGVFRAMGYRKCHIRGLFMMEASYIIILANVLSGAVAMTIAKLVSPILETKIGFEEMIHISVWNFVVTLAITITIGFIFSIYPSNKAAKLDAAEALRSE